MLDTPQEINLLSFRLFLKALEGEKTIEIARKTLVSNAFFDPYSLFRVIDKDLKNIITSNDIFQFMRRFFPALKKSSVDYVFNIMSKGGDIMTFELFAPVITPRDYKKPFKNIYYMNSQSDELEVDLGPPVCIDFCNLVKCIHDEYLSIDRCCIQLQNHGVNGQYVYDLISQDEKGCIRPDDLMDVLEPFCHYLGILL